MPIPLLTTKMHTPLFGRELISRPRLIERLNAGLWQSSRFRRRLTLASAPAGFGKTTMLAEWVRQLGDPAVPDLSIKTAWLSLDAQDNDPVRFWRYFVTALRRADPEIGTDALATLQSSVMTSTAEAAPIEVALLLLVNQIAESSSAWVLVLDDYHAITSRSIHEAMAFLLERLPPQMHLAIATRADPPLPIARLRGRGQMLGLYQSDLRFSLEEVTEFLDQVPGLGLSDGDVAALEERTEGWIAGLQMAALSMRRHDDIAGYIQAFTGTHRYILDYLVEEVLQQQSPAVRQFLLQTSILDRLSSPLCNAVIGADEPAEGRSAIDSQSVLEHLERNNLFVVPLDDRRQWYRYHHLFADLLRQRLQREQRDSVPELHRRASMWYERNGSIREAVNHVLAAGDYERMANLVGQNAWTMLARGEMITLLRWLDGLPDEMVRSRSQLAVLRAWALAATGQVDGVEPCLVGVDLQPVEGEVAAVRAYVAHLGRDLPQAIEFCHQALELLPEENLFLRSIVALILETGAYWPGGDPLAASQALVKATTLGQASGNIHLDVTSTCNLGHVQVMQGQLHLAVETFGRAFQIATAGGKASTLFVGLGHVGMAKVLYEWNDLDGAMRHTRVGIELGERGESVDVLLGGYSYLPLARVYQARGEWEKALQVLEKAEQFAQRCNHTHVKALVAASRARLWLARGNLATASRWAQASRLMPTDEPEYEREFEHTTLSWVLIAQGKPDEALYLLARLQKAAEAMDRIGRLIEIHTLQALAHRAQSDEEQALSALQRALSLAEPEGFVRTFVDEGEPMASLLRQALARGIAPNYVARLLAAFGQEVELASSAMESLVEPLTERELEVLRLIVAGLSNSEIAEELVIAVSTVKSHVNHIYGKLGVESRTQAVAKAQELALL